MDDSIRSSLETKTFINIPNALGRIRQIFLDCFGQSNSIVVSDENTYRIAGKKVTESLKTDNSKAVDEYIYPAVPILSPDYTNIQKLRNALN